MVSVGIPTVVPGCLDGLSGCADSLVDVLGRHEMLVIPNACVVSGIEFFLSGLLFGDCRAQGVAQTFDEGELHLIAGILDEIPVNVGFPLQY